MRVKVVSGGTYRSTKLVDADTGKDIDLAVHRLTIYVQPDEPVRAFAVVYIDEVEMIAELHSPPARWKRPELPANKTVRDDGSIEG